MALMTTGDLINLLQIQDPPGTRLVMIRVWDETDPERAILAYAELDERAVIVSRDAQQMQGKDRDILRIDVPGASHGPTRTTVPK